MAARVLYHCPCDLGVLPVAEAEKAEGSSGSRARSGSLSTQPPASRPSTSNGTTGPAPPLPSEEASARYSFHPLPVLYYCGDCLACRCPLCAQAEVITHYCPACLFEVPSASVKAERNRCPRNCFLCPVDGCGAVLRVEGTDPTDYGRLEAPEASIGQAPYFLVCMQCRWDSKKGIAGGGFSFDKPTGISAQLEARRGIFHGQAEMDRLRSHYESHIRKVNASKNQNAGSIASSTALSKSKLLRDLPGLEKSKYLTGSKRAAALGLDKNTKGPTHSEDLPPYRSELRIPGLAKKKGRNSKEGSLLQSLSGGETKLIASFEARCSSGWDQGPWADSLEPLRVPLKTKSTLRCPTCRHILIKPDPKAASYRWKIKLTALNHLPEINVAFKGLKAVESESQREERERRSRLTGRASILNLKGAPTTSALESKASQVDAEALQAGETYMYEMSFRNPLEDAIRITLDLRRRDVEAVAHESAGADEVEAEDTSASVPYTVRPSTTKFSVKPYDDVDIIDEELRLTTGLGSSNPTQISSSSGVIRQSKNVTTIGLQLKVAENHGGSGAEVEFPMLVTYAYPVETEGHKTGKGAEKDSTEKTTYRSHSFWTAIRLGRKQAEDTRGVDDRTSL